jgi:hypothetical protein
MPVPSFVLDPIVRRRLRLRDLEPARFEIRVARTERDYEHAFRLVHAAYVTQGVQPLDRWDVRVTEQHVLPETTVLVAYEDERFVGTMTVTLDSPAGLPAQHDYPQAIEERRAMGRRLAELGSFAIVRRCRGSGVAQLLSMAAARIAFRLQGADELVCGMTPSAFAFYRAVWGFQALGEPVRHSELVTPTVGIALPRDRLLTHLRRHYPRRLPTGHTMEEHIFGPVAHLPGFALPEALEADALARWKMSRQVFRSLFRRRSDRLDTLSPATLAYLRRKRSDETLGRIPTDCEWDKKSVRTPMEVKDGRRVTG